MVLLHLLSYQPHRRAELDAALYTGKPLQMALEAVKTCTIVCGAKEAISSLHSHGVKTAILSGGLDLLCDHVAQLIGIDAVYANHLDVKDGLFTGSVQVVLS